MTDAAEADGADARRYRFGPFRLDAGERQLTRDGEEVVLTRKAFDVLLALVERAGALQSRDTLIRLVWQGTIVEEHGLTWYLSVVRKALGDTGATPHYIETVRGHGYRFVAEVERLEKSAGGHDEDPLATTSTFTGFGQSRSQPRIPWSLRNSIALAAAFVILAAVAGAMLIANLHREPLTARAHSIAVLPFENLGPDKDIAYLVSGIQSIIASRLANIGDLRVVSRNSSERYPSRPDDPKAVADQLGVASVLEGSVQKVGEKLLITVQLVDGDGGKTLWAQTYSRTLDDVFAVEGDIAERVASAMKARVDPDRTVAVQRAPTQNAQAYNFFLQAEYLTWQIQSWSINNTPEASERAATLYRRAIALDDRFALALARLSYLQSFTWWTRIDRTSPHIEEAEECARRALAIAPDLPQAHLARGYLSYFRDRNYAAAVAEFERAQAAMPNNADVIGAIAGVQRRQGRWDEALAGFERASSLDPRNPTWPLVIATTNAMLRNYDQSVRSFERVLAVDPGSKRASANRLSVHLLAGDEKAAMAELANIPAGAGPSGMMAAFGFQLAWLANQPADALDQLVGAADWIDDPWMQDRIPTDLLRASALAEQGQVDEAHDRFAAARNLLEQSLHDRPDDAILMSLVGIAQAGLGECEAAAMSGHKAMALVPSTIDAVDGPQHEVAMAQILTRCGDFEGARSLLKSLLMRPAGEVVSEAIVGRDPRFHALRESGHH